MNLLQKISTITCFLILTSCVYAQESTIKKIQSDQPMEVMADEIEWDRTHNLVTGKGNASIKQGNSVIKAPEIRGYFIEADGHRALNKATANGGVHLTQDDRVLTSDEVIAFFEPLDGKHQMSKAEAMGHVHITSPNQVATGDKAIYDPREDSAVLVGQVILQQGQNQLRGDWAKTNFATGHNELKANKNAQGQMHGGQVHGLLFPKER